VRWCTYGGAMVRGGCLFVWACGRLLLFLCHPDQPQTSSNLMTQLHQDISYQPTCPGGHMHINIIQVRQ